MSDRPALFAFIEHSPRYNPRKPIRLATACRWIGDSWTTSRRLGEKKSRPHQMFKEGPVPERVSHNPYDVRAVPDVAVDAIKGYDEQITRLQQERETYIRDNFLTWPLVKKEDCDPILPGTPKSVVMEQLRAEAPLSKAAAKSEAQMVRRLNEAIGDME